MLLHQSNAACPAPRQRILIAAHDLFYREGIRATGVDRVIAQAQVSKVTFYRQFKSKDALIAAYLDYRHDYWISWFRASIESNVRLKTSGLDALMETLRSWWESPDFRGCAFINAVVELGPTSPETLDVFRKHKADMRDILSGIFPAQSRDTRKAYSLALAVDGAIVQVQAGVVPAEVLQAFRVLVAPLFKPGP